MNIKEDVAPIVTTTDNAGAGMDSPKLPIKPKTILKRYKELKRHITSEHDHSDDTL